MFTAGDGNGVWARGWAGLPMGRKKLFQRLSKSSSRSRVNFFFFFFLLFGSLNVIQWHFSRRSVLLSVLAENITDTRWGSFRLLCSRQWRACTSSVFTCEMLPPWRCRGGMASRSCQNVLGPHHHPTAVGRKEGVKSRSVLIWSPVCTFSCPGELSWHLQIPGRSHTRTRHSQTKKILSLILATCILS